MITIWIHRHWSIFSSTLLGLGLVWMVLTATLTSPTTQGQTPTPRQGFQAPDFTLSTLAGDQVSLGSLKGKVVVLNLWATWCAFCETEMPAFQNAYEAFKPQGDVIILAVNSTIQDRASAVSQFVARKGLQFSVPLDIEGRVTRLYQVQALPTTFFIDRQGIIRDIVIGGPLTLAMIQSRTAQLLNQVP
jgi:peroxiredoxin